MGIFDNNSGGTTTTILEEKPVLGAEETMRPSSVACFVILEHSEAFGTKERSYNFNILGNPMFTWVARACPSIPATIEAERGANVLELIRPYLKDSEYTLVLYSDTPLITRGSIDEILEYMTNKGLNVCKLTRGIVFRTEYIKRVGEVFAPQTYYFDEEDFITAVNFKQLSLVSDILKTRILEYHMKNGVYFENPDLVIIDANVSIGSGTKIVGRTRLTGRTEIGENCIIEDSVIDSCKIYDEVMVRGARIEKSVVEHGSEIEPGATVADGSMVNKNSHIGRNVTILKSSVGENAIIGDNCFVSNSRIHNLCKIEQRCDILGSQQKIVRILENVVVGAGSKVQAGVMIGAGVTVADMSHIDKNIRQGESL